MIFQKFNINWNFLSVTTFFKNFDFIYFYSLNNLGNVHNM